jgi:3-oxoacyl-[acyl-carrier-protein] synthase II
MSPLAITGVGVVSALGIGGAPFVRSMFTSVPRAGQPHAPETFDGSKHPRVRVAEVRGFEPSEHLGDKGLRSLDRLTKLLLVATRLALHDARLKREGAWAQGSPERVGIVVSNAYGSLEAITELDRVALLEAARYINPSRFPLTVSNSAAGYASIWEDLRAINVSVSDGNCGALDAVACASVYLDQGRADVLMVGGAEAMSEALALAFDRLGSLVAGVCLGEGAALFAIETVESAGARDAPWLATVGGYGTSFIPSAREGALVHPSAAALERAIVGAMMDASIDSRDVDVVVSGIAGLMRFDDAELRAIHCTVGEGVPVVAPKRALGESFGAGAALGMAAALGLLHGGEAPVVRGALRRQPRTVLVTSMGYYGNASALVMRHPPR